MRTENLPMLQGLRAMGFNDLADELQAKWKPIIDSAYHRDYPNSSPRGRRPGSGRSGQGRTAATGDQDHSHGRQELDHRHFSGDVDG